MMNGMKKMTWLLTAVLAIGLTACGKDKMEGPSDQGGMNTPMATMQSDSMMKDDNMMEDSKMEDGGN